MAVKERGRERGAISRRMLEEREGGGGGGGGEVGNSKKEEGKDGRRWTGTKPLGGGWKRKHGVKDKDEKEKEQEEGDSKNQSFVSLHFLFTQIQTKKSLFAGLRTPVHRHTR